VLVRRKVLEVAVKPGWKKGTTVTFECEGDEAPGIIPADIQFVIGEKEHATFSRDGNNLVYNARLTLSDALCGTTLRIATLDGRTISVPVAEVVSPGSEKIVRGEGMPIAKSPGTKGDLVIRFAVAFPAYLSDDKKSQLRRLLA
jgi:DnaJ homolog subfamily B member 4